MTTQFRLALASALLASLLGISLVRFYRSSSTAALATGVPANALAVLQSFEDQQAQRYWGPELLAEKYGTVIDQLWDEINASADKLEVVGRLNLRNLRLPDYPLATVLPWGINVFRPSSAGRTLEGPDWHSLIRTAKNEGWALVQCEFRHIGFAPANSGPPSSTFYFSAHLTNSIVSKRAILEGNLQVQWNGTPESASLGSIDATSLEVRTRSGPPAFRPVLMEEVEAREGSYFVDPLIVWDLDRDGASELVLAAANGVYRRAADGTWNHTPLCDSDPGIIFTGVLGDFDGNGTLDFLCAKFEGLFLYEGTSQGRFPNPPRQVWAAQPHLKYAQALAIGDIDGDGDLDVFLGQYKVPYDKGQMPRPYFEANDGYPYFLLQNDGAGSFTDITQAAGLGAKRARRAYNASFVDLDADGHLDLVLVSDFAGLDCYRNDGSGHFKDTTVSWFPERHALGMGSCFADFDRDGRLDVFMVGMNSPTADRLGSLRLNRPYDLPDDGSRAAVTCGNRLLCGRSDGRFQKTSLSDAVARTGWSWGCAAADLDNDGYPDLYIANGHETRKSVRDYESEFWLHDIYVGNSTENSLAQAYFREKMARTRGRGWSYGGYEKNRLFLNLGGTNFLECAFLLDVALESDSRNVVAADLDGDGRVDLVVTTFEIYPKPRQTLQVFRNELPLPLDRRVSTVLFRDLNRCGRVLRVGSNRVEVMTSTGSYRSQSQPAIYLNSQDAAEVVKQVGVAPEEVMIRTPHD